MRFMMLIKGNAESEAGVLPSQDLVNAMLRYNEEMAKAGVLADLNGLHPRKDGVTVRRSGGKVSVIDGPFAETKEVLAGYWIIKTNSLQEAIDWAKKMPGDPNNPNGEGELEIRQIYEMEELGMPEATAKAAEIGKDLAKNNR